MVTRLSRHMLVFGGSIHPDHDALMRIGGEAPGSGPILLVGFEAMLQTRITATSDCRRQPVQRRSAEAVVDPLFRLLLFMLLDVK